MRFKGLLVASLLAITAAQPVGSQHIFYQPPLTYADLVDLALVAPVVAHVRVEREDALSAREAGAVPAGHRRHLVEANIAALIRGEGGLPGRISYLVDLPNDARGRAQRIRRRTEFLVFASRVPGRPSELRLVAPDAQLPFSAEAADRLRQILRETSRPDAPPQITGIGRGFHVAGSLPGEGETQIFLQTADNRPISLNVLRRPGEQPYWAVALGEMVDEAAQPPQSNSLLWYRLACFLPRTLPPQSLDEATPAEARSIAADYRLVLDRLGPCTRNRVRR